MRVALRAAAAELLLLLLLPPRRLGNDDCAADAHVRSRFGRAGRPPVGQSSSSSSSPSSSLASATAPPPCPALAGVMAGVAAALVARDEAPSDDGTRPLLALLGFRLSRRCEWRRPAAADAADAPPTLRLPEADAAAAAAAALLAAAAARGVWPTGAPHGGVARIACQWRKRSRTASSDCGQSAERQSACARSASATRASPPLSAASAGLVRKNAGSA